MEIYKVTNGAGVWYFISKGLAEGLLKTCQVRNLPCTLKTIRVKRSEVHKYFKDKNAKRRR